MGIKGSNNEPQDTNALARNRALPPVISRTKNSRPDKVGRSTLLHASSLEKPGIGRVLHDVGGVALLGSVNFTLVSGSILVHLGIVTRPLMTAVGRRHWRHFIVARHAALLRYCS